MSEAPLNQFSGRAVILQEHLAIGQDGGDAIARLQSIVAAQARIIKEQVAALAHSRKIFERASAAARIGVWECELPGEKLTWTEGVYDIFEFPRGAAIDRERTLRCYAPDSAALLDQLRSRAIADRGGFCFDAEITTATGKRRWMRVTATVESENGVPARIFGMKQDITEEKLLADQTRYLAEFDVMTGLANRQRFQSSLDRFADEDMPVQALLLVDLDGFKTINDTYGHALGDVCLTELARRLRDVCGKERPAFRIGGDEFAVFCEREEAEELARRIVEALGRPVEAGGQALLLGASVGVANHAQKCTGAELFKMADKALYAAKAAGRNTHRCFVAAS